MYGCESWTIKKAERCKNWCFQTAVLEKTLESPLDCKEIQSILKEINPEYSLEGLMLKLKLQYSGHLMQRADSLEKTLMLGKTEGRKRSGQQRMRWLDGITDSMDVFEQALGDEGQGSLACCSPQGCKESDMTEQQQGTRHDTYSRQQNSEICFCNVYPILYAKIPYTKFKCQPNKN